MVDVFFAFMFEPNVAPDFFFDNNGYDILIKWCNHRNRTRLQNSLDVALEVSQSLNICPYGSDNIGLEFYICLYGTGKDELVFIN